MVTGPGLEVVRRGRGLAGHTSLATTERGGIIIGRKNTTVPHRQNITVYVHIMLTIAEILFKK